MSFCRTALLACLVSLASGMAHATDSCTAKPAPPVQIDVAVITSDQPPVDRSLSVLELTQLARRQSGAQRTRGRVMGLTSADFRFGIDELRLSSTRSGAGMCVTPTVIEVKLQAVQRIHIVNSARRDACWEESILNHERQHVRFNNDAVRAAGRSLEIELARLADRPVAVADLEEAGDFYGRLIDRAVNEAAAAAFAQAARRHAAIDTPRAYGEEFTAIRRKCGPRG